MNGQTVTTNLRMDSTDWLQVKTMAAELGMSTNQYINYLIKDLAVKRQMAVNPSKNDTIWNLSKLASIVNKPLGALSKEDNIIYG